MDCRDCKSLTLGIIIFKHPAYIEDGFHAMFPLLEIEL